MPIPLFPIRFRFKSPSLLSSLLSSQSYSSSHKISDITINRNHIIINRNHIIIYRNRIQYNYNSHLAIVTHNLHLHDRKHTLQNLSSLNDSHTSQPSQFKRHILQFRINSKFKLVETDLRRERERQRTMSSPSSPTGGGTGGSGLSPTTTNTLNQTMQAMMAWLQANQSSATTNPPKAPFLDHYSDFTYVHLRTEMTAAATVEAKQVFERVCASHGVKVQHYHCDNGLFDTKAFRGAVKVANQNMTFCGVNAHHQNGKAEARIKDITTQARTSLQHAAHRWPKAIHASLWPAALKH